jgi:FMN-dependent NADH-azoreductase
LILKQKNLYYYKLRNILLGKEIKYHDIDMIQIPSLNKKYDLVVLSNIASYLDYIYDKDHLKNFKQLIDSIKDKDTRVVVTYLYDNMLSYDCDNYIYMENAVNKYFDSSEYEYLSFGSTDIYEYPRLLRLENRVDKILVNKVKKEEI